MPHLERLAERHAAALLDFELTNRAYFARSIPDRGDAYFAGFTERHAALLTEQATGRCHFHLLIGDDGAILGRFNLIDVEDGSADLGFRMAQQAAGQGLAKTGVRQIHALARDAYGLRQLTASAALANVASRAVLSGTGFVPVGPTELNGKPALRHVLDLTATRIRPFRPTDAPAVAEIIATCLRDVNSRDYPPEIIERMCAHFTADRILELSEERQILIAESDAVDGTVSRDGNKVFSMFVHPRAMGRGVGRQLMSRLEELAADDGHTDVEAGASITAHAFYHRLGYVDVRISETEFGVNYVVRKALTMSR